MPLVIIILAAIGKYYEIIGWIPCVAGVVVPLWYVFYGAAPTGGDPASLQQYSTYSGSRSGARLYLLRLLGTRPDSEVNHTLTEYNQPGDDGYSASTSDHKGITRWWHMFRGEHLDD